ncbi:MAG: 50S ribosomal protein L25 [Candidatus Krumholzibacteriia bacterium]
MNVSPISVDLREHTGKGAARQLRASGRVPGVIYGEGEPARAIQIDGHAFDALVRSGGHHGLLDVTFSGSHEPVKALVREIQVHPVSRAVVHVDLQKINMQKPIRLQVPIVLVGKPEGVRNQGGILEHNLREVEIECLPSDIPSQIEVDVTEFAVGQALHVAGLQRAGITFVGHPETTVATVSLPAAERAHEEVAGEAAEVAGEEAATPVDEKGGEKAEASAKDEKGGSS